MSLYENDGMNIVDGRECGGLSHRWPSPSPCCLPFCCPPSDHRVVVTLENALAYAVCEHGVDPGDVIPYEVFVVNSPGGNITHMNNNTLLLQPGVYAVTFMSDAAAGLFPPDTDLGAALNLSGGKVNYAETLLHRSMPQDDRVTLNTILNLACADVLAAINNTNHKVFYENTSLTVIKLS